MTDFSSSRLLKFLNIAIALVLAAALALAWWFCLRPLPLRSGAITTAVAAPVRVDFDARGVPHIRAASLEDALFVQGYVTAQDRLWQMDGLRRWRRGTWPRSWAAARWNRTANRAGCACAASPKRPIRRLPAADRAAFARLRARREPFIATHLGQPAARIHAAGLPAAAVERGGFPADLPVHVSRPHHHLARRCYQTQHAGSMATRAK